MKNLEGFNETNLEEYERTSGLKIEVADQEHSDSIPVGSVIRQDPKAGKEVKDGSKVKVIISKGP